MSASAILRLQAAGFSTEQVTALAELIDAQAAAKSDVEASEHRIELKLGDAKAGLTAEIAAVKAELKGDIAAVKAELKGDIAAVKAELKGDIAAVKADVLVLKWMMGFILAFQVAIFGKLFLH